MYSLFSNFKKALSSLCFSTFGPFNTAAFSPQVWLFLLSKIFLILGLTILYSMVFFFFTHFYTFVLLCSNRHRKSIYMCNSIRCCEFISEGVFFFFFVAKKMTFLRMPLYILRKWIQDLKVVNPLNVYEQIKILIYFFKLMYIIRVPDSGLHPLLVLLETRFFV